MTFRFDLPSRAEEIASYTTMGERTDDYPPRCTLETLTPQEQQQRIARLFTEIHTSGPWAALNERSPDCTRLFFDFDRERADDEAQERRVNSLARKFGKCVAQQLQLHFAGFDHNKFLVTKSETGGGYHVHFPGVVFVSTSILACLVRLVSDVAAAIGLEEFLKALDTAPTCQRHLRVCGTAKPHQSRGRHLVIYADFEYDRTDLSIRPSCRQLLNLITSPSTSHVYPVTKLSKDKIRAKNDNTWDERLVRDIFYPNAGRDYVVDAEVEQFDSDDTEDEDFRPPQEIFRRHTPTVTILSSILVFHCVSDVDDNWCGCVSARYSLALFREREVSIRHCHVCEQTETKHEPNLYARTAPIEILRG